jgi:chromosome segregation ATPase
MKPRFWDYMRAAFNARPMGMFVPPNWIGLGVFGLLGILNPGFWIIGMGCELGYLGWLGTHPRFRNLVDGRRLLDERRQWQERLYDLLRRLPPEDQQRYRALQTRCESIVEQQAGAAALPAGVKEQSEGLARLMWIYLGLMLTRESIKKVIHESASSSGDAGRDEIAQMGARIAKLQERLKEPTVSEDLRKSLTGQIEILQQRLEKRKEAAEKLVFLEAELTRIEQQVDLLREQAVLSTDPEVVSQRIDQIATTLGGTNQWIRDQQKIYGAMEDLLAEPPPLVGPQQKESQ